MEITKVTQISIQKTVIDTVIFLQVEDAIIIKNKMFEKIAISGYKKHPLDKSCNVSQCAVCQPIYQWANDCPNTVKEEQSSHVKVTLFFEDIHKCFIETFEEGTLNCAF